MLSDIIKARLADMTVLGLVDRKTLFAENAVGDQYVLVLENSVNSPHEPMEALRQSDMQVLIVGFTMLDAKFKAEKIYELIGTMAGVYTAINAGVTETYIIKSVLRKPPAPLRWQGRRDFSINFTMHYDFSIA